MGIQPHRAYYRAQCETSHFDKEINKPLDGEIVHKLGLASAVVVYTARPALRRLGQKNLDSIATT